MGGIERILINYLNLLKNEPNLKIDILIAYDTTDNIFDSHIPQNVNITYLFDKKYFENKSISYEIRKKNLSTYIKYKLLKIKEKIIYKKILNNIILENNYDYIINFSNHFDPYIKFNKYKIPIIRWQHLAFNNKVSKKEINNLKLYNKVVSICDDMSKQITIQANIPNSQIETIFNPLNIDLIKTKGEEATIDKEFIQHDYLIQVSRLDKIKKHEDLIKIYHKLVNKGIKEKLYIIGNGPEYHNLKNLISNLGLQSKCILLGEITNPYPYIKNAKLFLHTSEREGLPTVLLESLILKTPVIAMNCPTGPREILNNGKCGILVPLGKIDDFVNKTFELLNNPLKQEEYIKQSELHIELFSENTIKDKFFKMLKSIDTSH